MVLGVYIGACIGGYIDAPSVPEAFDGPHRDTHLLVPVQGFQQAVISYE